MRTWPQNRLWATPGLLDSVWVKVTRTDRCERKRFPQRAVPADHIIRFPMAQRSKRRRELKPKKGRTWREAWSHIKETKANANRAHQRRHVLNPIDRPWAPQCSWTRWRTLYSSLEYSMRKQDPQPGNATSRLRRSAAAAAAALPPHIWSRHGVKTRRDQLCELYDYGRALYLYSALFALREGAVGYFAASGTQQINEERLTKGQESMTFGKMHPMRK